MTTDTSKTHSGTYNNVVQYGSVDAIFIQYSQFVLNDWQVRSIRCCQMWMFIQDTLHTLRNRMFKVIFIVFMFSCYCSYGWQVSGHLTTCTVRIKQGVFEVSRICILQYGFCQLFFFTQFLAFLHSVYLEFVFSMRIYSCY